MDGRGRARDEAPLPTWLAYLGLGGGVRVALVAGLFVWFYWQHLYRMFVLWKQPDWSHGFLIPVFCLYIVNTKRVELMRDEGRGSWWGLGVMLFSMAAYVLAVMSSIGYAQPLTIVTMLGGVVLLLRGWRSLRHTLFPIGLLILAIPPPERLYRTVTQPLQQGAAFIGQMVLGLFPGVDSIDRAGVTLAYFMRSGESGTFTVAGACSGMRSLMAFAALGLMMAYFTPRPAWHRAAMAILVVPVALFCNVLRVLITGGCQMYGMPQLSSGTPHMVLGFAMFGLGFLIYLGVLWVLDHLYVDGDSEAGAEARTA